MSKYVVGKFINKNGQSYMVKGISMGKGGAILLSGIFTAGIIAIYRYQNKIIRERVYNEFLENEKEIQKAKH